MAQSRSLRVGRISRRFARKSAEEASAGIGELKRPAVGSGQLEAAHHFALGTIRHMIHCAKVPTECLAEYGVGDAFGFRAAGGVGVVQALD